MLRKKHVKVWNFYDRCNRTFQYFFNVFLLDILPSWKYRNSLILSNFVSTFEIAVIVYCIHIVRRFTTDFNMFIFFIIYIETYIIWEQSHYSPVWHVCSTVASFKLPFYGSQYTINCLLQKLSNKFCLTLPCGYNWCREHWDLQPWLNNKKNHTSFVHSIMYHEYTFKKFRIFFS